MDLKDLELLSLLAEDGRKSFAQLSSELGITEHNVQRRMNLLASSGVLAGSSAFMDRRAFGFSTTYLKLHYRGGTLDRAIEGIMKLPQIAMVYPNMDDFMLVEVVHCDTGTLRSVIRALERVVSPFTVTAHYLPRLPDEVPEPPPKRWAGVLLELLADGRLGPKELSSRCGVSEEEAEKALRLMVQDGTLKVKPLIRDDLVSPFPAFSTLLLLSPSCDLSGCYGELMHISKEAWDSVPLMEPNGVWLRCLGRDLHAMDSMLERYRRLPYVKEVTVVLPEAVVQDRRVDMGIVRAHYGLPSLSVRRKGPRRRASRNR